MILSTLSEEQIGARYAVLPANLIDVLNAQSTKAAVDAIGREFGLGENQTVVLEIMVSLVFMGLLHPDMFAVELEETFGLDEAKAKDISLKLNADVFALYRADIEKVYMPAPETGPAPAAAGGATLDLSKAPAPLPVLGATPAPAAAPHPLEMKMTAPGAVPAPAPAVSPAASAPAAAPKPFILQKETAATQAAVSPGFRLNLNTKMFGGGASAPAAPPLPRPAELELGQQQIKKEAPKMVAGAAPQPKVVHYTDFKSSLGIPGALPRVAPPVPAPVPAVPAAPAAKIPAPVPLSAPASGAIDLRPAGAAPGRPAPASVPLASAPSSLIKNAPGVSPAVGSGAAPPPAAGQPSVPASSAPAQGGVK